MAQDCCQEGWLAGQELELDRVSHLWAEMLLEHPDFLQQSED